MTWIDFADKHFVGLCITAVAIALAISEGFSGLACRFGKKDDDK